MPGPRRFGTRAVHAAAAPLPAERPLAAPIWQTSTFAFEDAEHYAHTLRQPREGFVYSRYENPTTAALEATVADLEGAAGRGGTTPPPPPSSRGARGAGGGGGRPPPPPRRGARGGGGGGAPLF